MAPLPRWHAARWHRRLDGTAASMAPPPRWHRRLDGARASLRRILIEAVEVLGLRGQRAGRLVRIQPAGVTASTRIAHTGEGLAHVFGRAVTAARSIDRAALLRNRDSILRAALLLREAKLESRRGRRAADSAHEQQKPRDNATIPRLSHVHSALTRLSRRLDVWRRLGPDAMFASSAALHPLFRNLAVPSVPPAPPASDPHPPEVGHAAGLTRRRLALFAVALVVCAVAGLKLGGALSGTEREATPLASANSTAAPPMPPAPKLVASSPPPAPLASVPSAPPRAAASTPTTHPAPSVNSAAKPKTPPLVQSTPDLSTEFGGRR